MSLVRFFARRGSARVARDRLQILLAHERVDGGADLVAILREEILGAIGRHVPIDADRVQVRMNPGRTVSTLEIGIEMPTRPTRRQAA